MKNNIKKYQWLIFDADNTLYDYDKAEKIALLHTLDDFEIPYDKETIIGIYHEINHKLWMDFEKGLLKSQDEIKYSRTEQLLRVLKVDRNITHFAEDYLYNLSQNDQLLDNAYHVIETLAKTHKMIIMTNGMTVVQKPRFAKSALSKFFKHIVISEEIKHAKPSKEIFDHAFRLMRNPNKNTVAIIGDNLGSDIQGGINYEINSIWYNPNKQKVKHQATHELHDLLDLIK